MNRKKKNKEKKEKGRSRLYIIEAVVVIGLSLGVWIFTMVRSARSYVNPDNAVEIGGKTFSISDVNYFYYSFYNSYREQYGDYISYMFDEGTSLKEQEYEDGVSWFSYFLDESLDSMTDVVVVSEAAEKDGFELGGESRSEIRDYLDEISETAENLGITADEYLAQMYGEAMTLDRYGELMTMSYTARDYTQAIGDEEICSDEDIETYYEDHREAYDRVSYERLYFKAGEADGEPSQEALGQAEEQAEEAHEELLSGSSLKELSGEYGEAVYFSTEEAYYSEGLTYSEWLFAEDRRDGDSTVIGDGKGFYVLVFHGKSRDEYLSVNLRDIQFAADASAENPDEQYEESCAQAEAVYEEWKRQGAGEEAFAALAEKYAADGAQSGYYEDMVKGTADSFVEKWCFEEPREAGDCEVIYADSGFRVLYLTGFGEPAWKLEAERDLREERLARRFDDIVKDVSVKRHEDVLETAVPSLA